VLQKATTLRIEC